MDGHVHAHEQRIHDGPVGAAVQRLVEALGGGGPEDARVRGLHAQGLDAAPLVDQPVQPGGAPGGTAVGGLEDAQAVARARARRADLAPPVAADFTGADIHRVGVGGIQRDAADGERREAGLHAVPGVGALPARLRTPEPAAGGARPDRQRVRRVDGQGKHATGDVVRADVRPVGGLELPARGLPRGRPQHLLGVGPGLRVALSGNRVMGKGALAIPPLEVVGRMILARFPRLAFRQGQRALDRPPAEPGRRADPGGRHAQGGQEQDAGGQQDQRGRNERSTAHAMASGAMKPAKWKGATRPAWPGGRPKRRHAGRRPAGVTGENWTYKSNS